MKKQLAVHTVGSPCPFLRDRSCSIHAVRPASCRWFNVFRAPCTPGEDPYYTRRHDVLEPIPEYTDRAFAALLPVFNIKDHAGRGEAAIKLIRAQIMNLQTYNWKKTDRRHGERRVPDLLKTGFFPLFFPGGDVVAFFPVSCILPIRQRAQGTKRDFSKRRPHMLPVTHCHVVIKSAHRDVYVIPAPYGKKG